MLAPQVRAVAARELAVELGRLLLLLLLLLLHRCSGQRELRRVSAAISQACSVRPPKPSGEEYERIWYSLPCLGRSLRWRCEKTKRRTASMRGSRAITIWQTAGLFVPVFSLILCLAASLAHHRHRRPSPPYCRGGEATETPAFFSMALLDCSMSARGGCC